MLWQRTVRGAEWFDPPIVCEEEARSPDAERRVAGRKQRMMQLQINDLPGITHIDANRIAAHTGIATDEELLARREQNAIRSLPIHIAAE